MKPVVYNYVVVLDYYNRRVLKIKLTDEDKKFAKENGYEDLVDAFSCEYKFDMMDCEWMALEELKEESFNM